MQFLLIPASAVIGGLVGFVIRPSYLGTQLPLRILFSSHPGDGPFREELMTHLGICAVISLVGECVL